MRAGPATSQTLPPGALVECFSPWPVLLAQGGIPSSLCPRSSPRGAFSLGAAVCLVYILTHLARIVGSPDRDTQPCASFLFSWCGVSGCFLSPRGLRWRHSRRVGSEGAAARSEPRACVVSPGRGDACRRPAAQLSCRQDVVTGGSRSSGGAARSTSALRGLHLGCGVPVAGGCRQPRAARGPSASLWCVLPVERSCGAQSGGG